MLCQLHITIEEVFCEDIVYRIQPNRDVKLSDFTLEELSVLEMVTNKFKGYKSREIVAYMHAEKAYCDTVPNQLIPYSLSMQLNELK